MTEITSPVSFPIVFFDGEREIDIGNIAIYPSLEFKKFQSVLSQKIGISPHQISVSLLCRKSRSSATRKIPINEKANFGAIAGEKDCFFFAVLKRSRRERRGKPRQNLIEEDYLSSTPIEKKFSISPPEKMLLRRDPGSKSSQFSFVSPYYGQITSPESIYTSQALGLGYLDYENQLRNLQIQREKYLMSANLYPYTEMEDEYVFRRVNERIQKGIIVCEECSVAKGRPTPFHWCVYDAVTVGFRSPAGPIARPMKDSV